MGPGDLGPQTGKPQAAGIPSESHLGGPTFRAVFHGGAQSQLGEVIPGSLTFTRRQAAHRLEENLKAHGWLGTDRRFTGNGV